jgi:ABC-2 type transport system permease protein
MITEIKLLLRSVFNTAGILIYIALAAISLYVGKVVIDQKQSQISAAYDLQAKQRDYQLAQYAKGGDAGETAYYVFHLVADKPSSWSFVSIGNRDVNPAVQRVRMLGLQAQLYDGEAHNPNRVITGTFDYAFVIVFLLPLLCIALCHNLVSTEREAKRLQFLVALTHGPYRFWMGRLFLRWAVATLSVLLPFCVNIFYQGLFDQGALIISLSILLYSAFWCLLAGCLGFFKYFEHSVTNAITLLTLWLALTVIGPSIANTQINASLPMPKSAQIALEHRKKVNDAWDLPKETSFNTFFQYHPEWRGTSPVTTRFHWKWYYAFHHNADMLVMPKVNAQTNTLLNRHRYSQKVGWLLPGVSVQNVFDSVSDNSLPRLVAHRESITHFHTKLRLYFYPYVFNEKPFYKIDFESMPTLEINTSKPPIYWLTMLSTLAACLLLLAIIRRRARQILA